VVVAASEKRRATDGSEAFITLTSPDGTNSTVVMIWRDEASHDAYAKVWGEMVANFERDSKAAGGATIGEPKLYQVTY
jgi:hypothetical protein